jgi:RHS repeat-associated protein
MNSIPSVSRKFIRNFFALVLLLFFSQHVKAAIETDVNRLTGSQVTTGAVVTAVDNKYSYMVANNSGYPTPAYLSVFSLNSGVGRFTVGVDPNALTYVSTGYTANVTVQIAYYTDASLTTPLSLSNQVLTVKYDPYTNPANQSLQLDDRSLFEINATNAASGAKVVRVEATIVSITDASLTPMTAPANLYLEVSTEVERFYAIDLANVPTPSILASTAPSTGNANELTLNWAYIPGAESYDVEWTYVNDYTSAGVAMTTTVANANLVLDFAHNTTRVNVKGNSFGIPLIFDEGYIAFRIRAVGYAYNSSTSQWLPVKGRWTGENATTYLSTPNMYLLGDFKTATAYSSTNHTFQVTLAAAYRLKMNWQYNAAFAEDGKKKEVVAFYDGSLHNRQTITKTSTDKKVLVGETIYDYEGRPAINVLPSPVEGNNMPLTYQVSFNRNSSSKAYSKADFDKDASSCATTTPAMNTNYGTAKYYSPNNTEQADAQAFLPNASGYPFAQTELNPDNTGRVRRQGSVGPDHQVSGAHDVQYYYGHPAQEELDRLFGSDVGYAQHYNKTVTIDANGQASVTYVDQEGRTIATGIGSDTLSKPLLALREGGSGTTSYSQNALSLTVDLLAKDDDADVNDDEDNNMLSPNGDMLEVSNQVVVSTASDYSFAYSLTGDKFSYECLPENVCYTCVYDMEIDILDQCGNHVALIPSGTLPVTQTLGTISYNCTTSTASFDNTLTPLVVHLTPGVYTVYKRLKVNHAALVAYQANYLAQSTCVTSESSMVSDAVSAVDTSSCTASCTDCDDYQSPCEASHQMMLSDVSPNGQYGEYRDNYGNINPEAFPVSVYNTSNMLRTASADWRHPLHETNGYSHYYEADGSTRSYIALSGTYPNYFPAVDALTNVVILSDGLPYIDPEHLLNVEDFAVNYWRDSWALSLVKYHPEYCYYAWCSGNTVVQTGSSISSDEFDRLMMVTTTKAAAVTAGLLDPLANANGTAVQSSATDAYFRTGGLGAAQYTTAANQLLNYSGTNSIWKVAKIMTTCGYMFNATQTQIDACTGASGGNETNFITGDAEWMNFRMLYLSLKQHYQGDKADASAMSCDGYNGCIGTTAFSPMADGMITFPYGSSEFADNSVTTGDYSRQPCSDLTYPYYAGKQKRFPNEDDVVNVLTGNTVNDLAALQTAMDNNYLLTTGQCPIDRDLQSFLTKLASTNQLKASALNLQTITEFTPALYNTVVPTSVYTTVNYAGTGTGATLTMAFTGTSVSCGTSPTLSFGSSSTFTWANYNSSFRIVGFSALMPDGSGGFSVIASIDDDMNTSTAPITEYMTGTGGCISLTCSVPTTVCTLNATGWDLFNLLNVVTPNGDISNTSPVDLSTGSYSSFLASTQLNNYVSCGSGTDTYLKMTTSLTTYHIQCGTGSPSNYLSASFSPALPSGTINSFSNPVLASSTSLGLTVTYGGTSTMTTTVTLSYAGGGATSPVNLGTCGAPVPEQCEGIEYTRRRDLENLLNAKATSLTTTDASLNFNSAFTVSLQQFGAGAYSWTPVTSPTNSQWIAISNGSQTCSLQLQFAGTPASGHAFNNIVAFGQLVADETNTINGLAYNFTITAWYSDGTSELISGTSCYVIRNCPVCTAATHSLYQNFDLVNTSSPGYTSGLTYGSSCPSSAGNYTLLNNIATTCGSSYTGVDHDNVPNGKFMAGIFNHNATTSVWNKSVTVVPYAPYTFQCWFMDPTVGVITATGSPAPSATVELWANGVLLNSTTVDDTRPGEWHLITGTWTGAATAISCTAEVKVTTNNPASPSGNWKIAFDDFAFYTPGCGPQYIPPVSPSWSYNAPCASNLVNIATLNAQQEYEEYANTVSAQFTADYIHHCINSAVETFKQTFNENEYQYTLYYYDQAGNLVQTVPPQGVTTIALGGDANGNTTPDGIEIKAQREARLTNPSAAKTFYTSHRMKTNYVYNSLNQLISQTTPDGGTSYFWYDKLGRIIASQNAKQAAASPQAWSYTIYDALGRISEVGELYTNTDLKTMSSVTLNTTLNASNYPDNWAGTAATNNRNDVTKTYYDVAQSFGVASHFSAGLQENLRKRVATAAVYDTYNGTNTAYTSATHYTYDIHGNVKEIIQETPSLAIVNDATAGVYQSYKQVRYTYDLVSGNVKEVWYQDGQADRYYHKYHYDADNRVTAVYTSNDKRHWDRDAKYFYYKHGPLARTEYGQNKVQGADDMYTIQGWIKGVNSNGLGATNDAGKDAGTTTNAWVGTDEYGYSLGYYSGDYASIATTNAIASIASSGLDAASFNLYNGNIRHMVTSIKYFGNTGFPGAIQAMAYKYDQLNRIRSSEQYTNYDGTTNTWSSGGSGNAAYKEGFTYDHNGNIIRQKRNGSAANTSMDDLHYYYYKTNMTSTYDPATGTPSDATNKLAYVSDAVTSTYTDDIDNQAAPNYAYDEIGQLKSDVQEQIGTIAWTVYGKIRSVTRSGTSTKADLEYHYDAMGNRYVKIVKPRTGGTPSTQDNWTYTYYVRDAQGNVMATYERTMVLRTGQYTDQVKLKEQDIYGSSRVGIKNNDLVLTSVLNNFVSYSGVYLVGSFVSQTTPSLSATAMKHTINMKVYELNNHLGNVLVTVSDARQILNTSTAVTGFAAIVKSATDYSAFGAPMAGRVYTSVSYRYGFNGKEKTDEMHGNSGDEYDFGARIYDARVGRWSSVDQLQKKYPSYSPYNFAVNSPIKIIDVDGKDIYLLTTAASVDRDANGNITAKHPGHTMIAVDNYDKVVTDVYDNAGNIIGQIETYVPNGTVTVYDLNTPNNVGKLTYMKDQPGVVGSRVVNKSEILKGELQPDKPNQFNGVIEITTDHATDQTEAAKMDQEQKDYASGKKKFNGRTNNCSDFAVDIINDIPGYEDVTGIEDIQPTGTILQSNSVTPNKLFMDVAAKTAGDKGCGKIIFKNDAKLGKDWIEGYTGGEKKDKTPGK